VLDTLDRLKLTENTLVILTSKIILAGSSLLVIIFVAYE